MATHRWTVLRGGAPLSDNEILVIPQGQVIGRREIIGAMRRACGCDTMASLCHVCRSIEDPWALSQLSRRTFRIEASGELRVRGENAQELVRVNGVTVFRGNALDQDEWSTVSVPVPPGTLITFVPPDRTMIPLDFQVLESIDANVQVEANNPDDIVAQMEGLALRENAILLTLTARVNDEARHVVEVEEAEQIWNRWEQEIAAAGPNAVVVGVALDSTIWRPESLLVVWTLLEMHAHTVETLHLEDVIASLDTVNGLATIRILGEIFARSPVRVLRMANNALGIRALESLEQLLTNSRGKIQILSFYNCGLSAEAITILLRALGNEGCAALKELYLDRNDIELGASVVGDMLAMAFGLEIFSYCGNRPGPRGTKDMMVGMHSLVENLAGETPALRVLHLDECSFGVDEEDHEDGENVDIPASQELIRVLQACTRLEKLSIPDSGMKTAIGPVMLTIAEHNNSLTSINLGGNEIGGNEDGDDEDGDEGVEYVDELVHLLESRTTWQEVVLDSNALDESENVNGVAAAVQALLPCDNLRFLGLEANYIGEMGARAILTAQRWANSLEVLDLTGNDAIPLGTGLDIQNFYPGADVRIDDDLEDFEEEE